MRTKYKSEVKQLLLAFTVDRWTSHTNIVSDFEQNILEQEVPKSDFHSKLPRFTLHIFRRSKVTETIVTVVYKQGHLALGSWISAYYSKVYLIFDLYSGPL